MFRGIRAVGCPNYARHRSPGRQTGQPVTGQVTVLTGQPVTGHPGTGQIRSAGQRRATGHRRATGQPVTAGHGPVTGQPVTGHRSQTGHRSTGQLPVTGQQPVNRSVDRLTGQRAGQPVNRSVDRSMTGHRSRTGHRSAGHRSPVTDRSPVNRSTTGHRSAGQPVNRAARQPDIQSPPVSRSSPVIAGQPVKGSVDQSPNRGNRSLINQSVNRWYRTGHRAKATGVTRKLKSLRCVTKFQATTYRVARFRFGDWPT